MRQRWTQFDWSIALVLSAALHVAIVWWMLHEQISALAGLLREGVSSQWVAFRRHADDELGEVNGAGTAISPSEGDQPASGREADEDQPFLSRDDAGLGHVGDAPSKYTGPTGSGASASAMQLPSVDNSPPPSFAGRPLEPQSAIPLPTAPPTRKPASTIDGESSQLASDRPEEKIDLHATPPTEKVQNNVAPPAPSRDVSTNAIAMNTPPAAPPSPARQPGLPAQSADPAPKSDSEIDPFNRTASLEIRAGKLIVQSGRKHKLTRPRLSLAGQEYLMAHGPTAMVLKLTIDVDGKVIRADVAQSSGSNEIDHPVCMAAYEWWFDPETNPAGQPIKSTFLFPVSYR